MGKLKDFENEVEQVKDKSERLYFKKDPDNL